MESIYGIQLNMSLHGESAAEKDLAKARLQWVRDVNSTICDVTYLLRQLRDKLCTGGVLTKEQPLPANCLQLKEELRKEMLGWINEDRYTVTLPEEEENSLFCQFFWKYCSHLNEVGFSNRSTFSCSVI
jgi:hypothetical protein